MDGKSDIEQAPQPARRGLLRGGRSQTEADTDAPPKAKSLGPLKMIYAEAAKYPVQVALALLALTVTAAGTLAIPAASQPQSASPHCPLPSAAAVTCAVASADIP